MPGRHLGSDCGPWAHGPNLSAVKRSNLHYWSVIALLLARLLLGDFVHAVPHGEHLQPIDKAQSTALAGDCPDHAASVHIGHSGGHESDGASHDGADPAHHAGKDDCCKSTACNCLCAHLAPLMTSTQSPAEAFGADPGVSLSCIATPTDRLSALFRPPA